jgi:hypothetical protein
MTNSPAGLKRRSACDRCRSQKLRCLRRPGEEICTRCLSTQSRCIFGASRRGLRPHTVREDEARLDEWNATVESPAIEADVSTATSTDLAFNLPNGSSEYDVFSVFTDFAMNQYDLDIPGQNAPLVSDAATKGQTATFFAGLNGHHGDMNGTASMFQNISDLSATPALLTGKLAELSVSLADHASIIPPLSIHRTQLPVLAAQPTYLNVSYHGDIQSCAPDRPLVDQEKVSASPFALEDTFRLTQTLVDICPRVIKTLSVDQSSEFQRSSDNTLINSTSLLASPPVASFVIDHGLILLMLSCHHRLIDIWEAIFDHVKVLAELPGVPECQKVQIGSFAPSSSTTSNSLQVALIIELTAQLQNQACQLRDAISVLIASSSLGYEAEQVDREHVQRQGTQRLQRHNESTKMVTDSMVNRLDDMLQKVHFLKGVVERKREERVQI